MPRPSLKTLLVSTLLFLATGCGTTMYSHDRGKQETPGEAPSDGVYVLFAPPHPKALKTVELKRGDPLGFSTAETGQIDVVAGPNVWTMEDANMIWKRQD